MAAELAAAKAEAGLPQQKVGSLAAELEGMHAQVQERGALAAAGSSSGQDGLRDVGPGRGLLPSCKPRAACPICVQAEDLAGELAASKAEVRVEQQGLSSLLR